jgi:hypothetical protein
LTVDAADVECLRRLLAEGIVDNADGRRRRHLRHRLRAVPRRPSNLREPRDRECGLDAAGAYGKFGGRFTPDAGWENFK